jgi:hypothetical protein
MIDPVEGPTSPDESTLPGIPSKKPVKPLIPAGEEQDVKQAIDPAGTWARFLSQGGTKATADDVKLFLQGFEKMLQVLVQRNAEAFKRSIKRSKEAQEGYWE